MDIACCVIWIVLCVISVAWSILPWVPWPQLAYLAILLAQFLMDKPFSWWFVIIWWILMIFLMLADYYLPVLWTKKFWWTKRWNWWCVVWMIVWIFFWPFGLILWPFVWSLVGEFLCKSDIKRAIKPAFWAFVGFVSWIVLKLVVSIILFVYFCVCCCNYFF